MSEHECFEVKTSYGPVMIYGDPAMGDETLEALMALATAAAKHYAESANPPAPSQIVNVDTRFPLIDD